MSNLKKILQMVVDYYKEVGNTVHPCYLIISKQRSTHRPASYWGLFNDQVSSNASHRFLFVNHQVLSQDISDFPVPDLSLVAEHADPVELGRLLQLILGCAVRCERKQGMTAFQIVHKSKEQTHLLTVCSVAEKSESSHFCIMKLHTLDIFFQNTFRSS